MTTATKTVNYTETQTADLKARYAAGESVVNLAKQFGKTTRSIVAKLSREGVYKAKEYVSKTGEKPVQKSELVQRISDLADIPIDQCDSLEKVNKQLLVNLVAALKRE
jgi:hypothetical protein